MHPHLVASFAKGESSMSDKFLHHELYATCVLVLRTGFHCA